MEEIAAQQEGLNIISSRCSFLAYADSPRLFPEESAPEAAFIGRSNVGKSSLLNALMGRNGLARTSKAPGRTQAIHFYDICELMRFVDMPGYGYARANPATKDKWPELIEEYFKTRSALLRTYLLIDGRYEPKLLDFYMHKFLYSMRIPYSCIITKIDKSTDASLSHNESVLRQKMAPQKIFLVSAQKKYNINLIKQDLLELL